MSNFESNYRIEKRNRRRGLFPPGDTTGVKNVLVNGLRAAYEVKGEGPDVLLIHGWMASKKYWNEANQRIPMCRIWALDLYGFGDSEKPATGYTLDGYTKFVKGFLDAVGVKKAAIVGHSMGGAIASFTAISSPQRFWALGLVDAALAGITRAPPLWSAEPVMRMFMRLADTSRSLGQMTITGMFGVGGPEGRIILEEARKADVRAASLCSEMMSRPTDWSGLRGLKVPAIMVYGADDFLVDRGMDKEIGSLLPRIASSYIEDCGHLPMLEKPDEFYGILDSFLEENRP
jgi:pimeloyl-ACP methyl ester carboxylesterase